MTEYKVTAINPKLQAAVNRFIKARAKYYAIVEATEDNGGSKQEKAWDRSEALEQDLPKRELLNINKTIGYDY